jgi:hypothetical protein
VQVIKKAMHTKLGETNEEVLKLLGQHGIAKTLANEALRLAQQQGRFTIFAVVDALTRLAHKHENAGDRAAADLRSASLLSLAA